MNLKITYYFIDTSKFHNKRMMKMSIMCKWCEEKFDTYAILEVHRMFRNGKPQCLHHPDLPKQYNKYSQLTTQPPETRPYKPRRTKPHKRID